MAVVKDRSISVNTHTHTEREREREREMLQIAPVTPQNKRLLLIELMHHAIEADLASPLVTGGIIKLNK